MAMERLRAQIMQQDQTGQYRVLGGNPALGHSDNSSMPHSGEQSMARPTLGINELSAQDHYGHPDSYAVGTIFASRQECYDAKVHREPVRGIAGGMHGAFSVVINGGYEDDIDEGDVIWYTGAGGQDSEDNRFGGSGPQDRDQTFEHPDNIKLRRNIDTRHPVRVIRGSKRSEWGPERGYRYDGLYDVISAENVKGKSGHMICRFKLQRRAGQTPLQHLPRK